jgi:phage portal protein BeeE
MRGLSNDGILGMNPIEIARESMGLGLSAQEYAARFFANDARPVRRLDRDGPASSRRRGAKVFRESWQRAQPAPTAARRPCSSTA